MASRDLTAKELRDHLDETRAALRARLAPSLERTLREALIDLEPLLGPRVLAERLRRLAAASYVEADVPTASRILGLAVVKRGVRALVAWYVRAIVQQVNTFAFETAGVLEAVSIKLDELERRLGAVDDRTPGLGAPIALPWPPSASAAVVEVVAELDRGARVLVSDATNDDLADALAAAGLDVLGTSLDGDAADALAAAGIDVRIQTAGELLGATAPGSIDAVVLRGAELEFSDATAKRRLITSARRVARGPVIVVWSEPGRLAAEPTLAGVLALHPGPLPRPAWELLLRELGERPIVAPVADGLTMAVLPG